MRIRKLRIVVALASWSWSWSGCNAPPLERPEAAVAQVGDACVPQSRDRALDVLFVIDDSKSMAGEQDLLRRQFPRLMLALGALRGGFPDAHIGVTSTDLGAGPFAVRSCETPGGDQGRLLAPPGGCPAAPQGAPFIRVVNDGGALAANVPDTTAPLRDGAGGVAGCPEPGHGAPDGAIDACDIAAAFSCLARLGTEGCGFEQPLEAAVQALCADPDALDPPAAACHAGPGGAHADFLRPHALLAVVFLGDEDDCSAANLDLFDPHHVRPSDPLGPLQSFRCLEFGARCGDRCAHRACDGPIARAGGQTLDGCRPIDRGDLAADERPWLHPPSRYLEFFSDLAAARGPGKLVVAAIAGPHRPGEPIFTVLDDGGDAAVAPSCRGPGDDDEAAPALRLRAVLDGLDGDGFFGEDAGAAICSDDFAPALDELARRIVGGLAPGCRDHDGARRAWPLVSATGTLIARPDQARCAVRETRGGARAGEAHTLPACEFSGPAPLACPADGRGPGAVARAPCWYFCDSAPYASDDDPATVACEPVPGLEAYPPRWQFHVCRDPSCDPLAPAPPGTEACVACATCNAGVGCPLP